MAMNEAENICKMLEWLFRGDMESWIGMLRCRGGGV
jgi:hypothetical protein